MLWTICLPELGCQAGRRSGVAVHTGILCLTEKSPLQMGFALLWAAVTATDKSLSGMSPSCWFFTWVKINKSGCLLLLLNGSLLEKARRLGKNNSYNNSGCFSRRWGDLGRSKVSAGASDSDHKRGQKREEGLPLFFQAPDFLLKTYLLVIVNH